MPAKIIFDDALNCSENANMILYVTYFIYSLHGGMLMPQKKKPVKRGKKKKPSLFKEVVGILVIMLGVLLFFAIFFEASTGVFGRITSNVLAGLLGWTYKLFPFLIALLGLFLIFTSYEINWERRSFLILLSVLLVSCFFTILMIEWSSYSQGSLLTISFPFTK